MEGAALTVIVRLSLVAVAATESVTRTVNVRDAPLTGLIETTPAEESVIPAQNAPVMAVVVHV
jgi:hypothetical protein